MPILGLQQRLVRNGAIRLGNRIPKLDGDGRPVFDKHGQPVMIVNKLETFRITSPHRDVADAVATDFGGQVTPWSGPRGPEWQVITDRDTLDVLVPRQEIDTNYEYWGRNVRNRLCDGVTERIRGVPCLCQQWNNHDHRFDKAGRCYLCGISRRWDGQPHAHEFDLGECVICGCTRLCKPTTRVNVLLTGIPGVGVFKVESHGFNAASELPSHTGLLSGVTRPIPATLTMRRENRTRVTRSGKTETRQFSVPELRFQWMMPEMIFDPVRLNQAARHSLGSAPILRAIGAAPETVGQGGPETVGQGDPETVGQGDETPLTQQDILVLIITATTVEAVRKLWKTAARAGCLDNVIERLLASRAAELKLREDQEIGRDVSDAEIVED